MLDIKYIRQNFKEVEKAINDRGMKIPLAEILVLDEERRKLIVETDNLRNQRKTYSEEIAKLKQQKDTKEKIDKISAQAEQIRDLIKEKEKNLSEIETKLENFSLNLPNIPDKTVPIGNSEKDNRIVSESETERKYDFEVLPHWEIGEKLDILDFKIASKISGTRFALLKKQGCQLERALISFMLDFHIKKHDYTEIFAPYLVNKKSAIGTGQLPKFEGEIYKFKKDIDEKNILSTEENELYLIPTAEMSITNIHRDEIIHEEQLPKKYVSYSACFRREAGSYGKDTKGLIRNHQFNKIELVKFTKPEDSNEELEKLLVDAQEILKQLQLKYRVVELCTADLGFSASKTYDLEVWMPGEKRYREVSSCSNFGDFQARRMNIKLLKKDGTKEFVHTINGSGLAIGRTFACILETYQNSDYSITMPEVLLPYLSFKTLIVNIQ